MIFLEDLRQKAQWCYGAADFKTLVKTLLTDTLGGLSYGGFLAGAAATVILVLGVVAALDQLEIARNVVDAVLYAALAALVGVVVVAVGGGGIQPTRRRWQAALDRYDQEKPRIHAQASQGIDLRDRVQRAATTAASSDPPVDPI